MKLINAKIVHTEKKSRRTVLYMWPVKESVMENLLNRRARPYNEMRRLIPQVLEKVGLRRELASTAKWSQKAGCGCGCSPGFILDYYSRDSIHADFSWHDDYVVPQVPDADMVGFDRSG